MNNRVVFIRLDANHDRGLGHLFRMLTLSEQLKVCNLSVTFIIRENVIAEKILKDKGYNYLVFPETLTEEMIILGCLREKENYPSLWIFDILSTEAMWVNKVKEKFIKVICFDDDQGGLLAADLVINPIIYCWDTYKKQDVEVPILEGNSCTLFSLSVQINRRKRIIPHNKQLSIGITMGGSDTHGSTVILVKALLELEPDKYNLSIFTGPHFLHQKELFKLLESFTGDFTIQHHVVDLHKELNNMDVVICGGGSTLFEVCSMGLSVLAFANESHEEMTIRYLESIGVCSSIGSVSEIDLELITNKCYTILSNYKKLNELSLAAFNYFSDNTIHNCVGAINNVLEDKLIVNGVT